MSGIILMPLHIMPLRALEITTVQTTRSSGSIVVWNATVQVWRRATEVLLSPLWLSGEMVIAVSKLWNNMEVAHAPWTSGIPKLAARVKARYGG